MLIAKLSSLVVSQTAAPPSSAIPPESLQLIKDLIPSVTWSVAIALLCFTIISGIVLLPKSGDKYIKEEFIRFFARDQLTRIVTIIVVIHAVTLLAILGKVGTESVAAIFSGVAGYVLGNNRKNNGDNAPGGGGDAKTAEPKDKKATDEPKETAAPASPIN